ncbi:MAG: redoxin domain-containing protein [Planctomycetota bacterium]
MRATDLDGVVHRLGAESPPRPVTLVFLGPECPISRRYVATLNELAGSAASLDVVLLGVLSDPELSVAQARAFVTEFEVKFPLLFDLSGDLAARLEPSHVPEAFVIDAKDRLVYRGRIDDRFAAIGKPRSTVSQRELADAITAAAAGEAPSVASAAPVGCVFEAWDVQLAERQVTYTRDVAPILRAHCVSCHRPGDIGPFPLLDYKHARRKAKMIAKVCADGIMPPWRAEAGFGHFRDEQRLSRQQIAVLRAWADGGAPEGDAADLLPAPTLPTTRWRLGEPDFEIAMPVDYPVPAAGDDIYRYFVIPSEIVEEKAVVAIDFRPGDPSVVHHCLAYLDRSGKARRLDERDDEPGFSVFGNGGSFGEELTTETIAGWAPGAQPYTLPKGMAQRLEPGGDFVLEVHYHPTGKATIDRSTVALYFAKEPVERYVEGLVIGTERIDIPPGEGHYRRQVWMDVPVDLSIIDITPHMHYLGKEVEAVATLPDGTETPLIRIADWDFRWQDTYVYREPVHLPKGTRIHARFRFDNSATNPANPSSPPQRVSNGWQTTDEMCLLYFTVATDRPTPPVALWRAMFASFARPAGLR